MDQREQGGAVLLPSDGTSCSRDRETNYQHSPQRCGLYACQIHHWSCSIYIWRSRFQVAAPCGRCCETGLHWGVDPHSWHGYHSPCGSSSWMPEHRWAVGCLQYGKNFRFLAAHEMAWALGCDKCPDYPHFIPSLGVSLWRQEQKDCLWWGHHEILCLGHYTKPFNRRSQLGHLGAFHHSPALAATSQWSM